MIKDPKANTPISGRGSGVIAGAAQGAAAGATFGPVGAIVGGIIGAASGFISGSEQDQSAKHATMAYKYAQLRQERQAAIVRRDKLREFRMARAMAMTMIGNEAGGTKSSAPAGAIWGLQAQYALNQNYFDADVYLNRQYQKHSNKAGKHAAAANMINAASSAVFQSAPAVAGAFSFAAPASRGYSGLGGETLKSTQSLSYSQPQNFNWIQAPNYNI
jgi:uncharacterized membrane protein